MGHYVHINYMKQDYPRYKDTYTLSIVEEILFPIFILHGECLQRKRQKGWKEEWNDPFSL